MFFHLSFVTLILALAVLGTPVKRNSTQTLIETDIQTLTIESTSLAQSINNFPNSGGTLGQAILIHNNAVKVAGFVKSSTSDLNASPEFTNEEANDVVNLMDTFAAQVQNACNAAVEKKIALTNIGVGSIAKKDLDILDDYFNQYSGELLLKFPADSQDSGQVPLNKIKAALTSATDAYATE